MRHLVPAELYAQLTDDDVGVVVQSRAQEELSYRMWRDARRTDPARLTATIGVTFACNLDCTYCCQSDVLTGSLAGATMSGAVGSDTAFWLACRAVTSATREIHLDFIGGEPLLHRGRIEQIVNDLRERLATTAPSPPPVTFGLITNGVFLTRELVQRWRPLGLVSAQVTLDGDESTHSLTRRSRKRGEDTFAASFSNLLAVTDLIKVRIKGNYQPSTVHGFAPLLGKLAAAGFPKGSRVRFSPAFAGLGAPSDAGSGSGTWTDSAPEVMIALSDEIVRAGFDPGDLSQIGPCGFHLAQSVAIDPDGHVYKCGGFLGKPEWAIAHVSTGPTSRQDEILRFQPESTCGVCAYRPECGGGCIASAWLKAGRAEGVSCERGFFELHQPAILKRQYALAACDSVDEALAMFPRLETVSSPAQPRSDSSLVQIRTATKGVTP